MRWLDIVTSAVFAMFLVLPVGSASLFGYSSLAETPPRLADMSLGELVAPADAARSSVARAIISNSPAGMSAIRAKSYLDYRILGFVNTSRIISGVDGWLFYRPEFDSGRCANHAQMERALHDVETMRDVAAAAGVELLFSISPDKSVVYPEKLGLRAGRYAGCKMENAAAWRAYAKSIDSSLIDHAAAMREVPGVQLYLATDTHWSDYGRAVAMRQLMMHTLNRDPGLPDIKDGVSVRATRDLGRMLRLDLPEASLSFPQYWTGAFVRAAQSGRPNVLILHDSFYAGSLVSLRTMFPGATAAHLERGDVRKAVAARPDLIVANSVERSFFVRKTSSSLSWSSNLGRGLLAINAAAAKCDFQPVQPRQIRWLNLKSDGEKWTAAKDPGIIVPLPSTPTKPCLRVRYSSESAGIPQIFLPPVGGSRAYTAGRRIDYVEQQGDFRSLVLVLPDHYAGARIRLDPLPGPGTLQNLTIETGSLVPGN